MEMTIEQLNIEITNYLDQLQERLADFPYKFALESYAREVERMNRVRANFMVKGKYWVSG